MGGKKRISEMRDNKNINIPLNVADDVFRMLCIDPEKSELMDLKKAIFKCYGLADPVMTVRAARKTLAQQRPNNAYGIRITDNEIQQFMDLFHLTSNDFFQESIGKRIVDDILTKKVSLDIRYGIARHCDACVKTVATPPDDDYEDIKI